MISTLDGVEERQNVDIRLLPSSLKTMCVELVVLVLYYRHAIIVDIVLVNISLKRNMADDVASEQFWQRFCSKSKEKIPRYQKECTDDTSASSLVARFQS
jgi:hypothetical protein